MSLLGKFGIFGSTQPSPQRSAAPKAPAAQRFCTVYNRFMFVDIESEDQETEATGSSLPKRMRREKILGDATESVLNLIRAVNGKSSESERVAVSLERLSMDEGTQLGQDYFTMLNAFSAALHKSYEADKKLLSISNNKTSMAINEQSLIQALQQHTFVAEGGDRLYSEVFKDEDSVPSNSEFESRLIPEIQRAQTERVDCISAALEPFVEAQIHNAREKVKAYSSLLEALQSK